MSLDSPSLGDKDVADDVSLYMSTVSLAFG